MSHTVLVPDVLYEQLAERAGRQGRTAEELFLAWVRERAALEEQEANTMAEFDPTHDPIASFIGAFSFGVGDLAEHHDWYLAQEALDMHADEE